MSLEIIPAILERTFGAIEAKIASVAEFAPWVQIDVCDGIFVPSYTWPYEDHTAEHDDGNSAGDIDSMESLTPAMSCEMHLMVANPEEVLHEWLARPEVKRVVVHVESTLRLADCLQMIRESGKEAGVALRLDTPLELVAPVAHLVDRIQVMSIREVGVQGSAFDPAAVIKVRQLRELYPNVTLSIDGGVTLENAPALLDAGADALVVGSALFHAGEPRENYMRFLNAQPSRGDN